VLASGRLDDHPYRPEREYSNRDPEDDQHNISDNHGDSFGVRPARRCAYYKGTTGSATRPITLVRLRLGPPRLVVGLVDDVAVG
jgi:hypothetical protein